MKIIRDRDEVLRRLKEAGTVGILILCPNAETPDEMEGILFGARCYAESRELPRILVGIGVTASYPDHPQLGRLAGSGGEEGSSLELTARTWMSWLEVYSGRHGLFDRVEAIPFLDHGWVPLAADRDLMNSAWFQEAMGIIMFDASLHDFQENARLTAEYVLRAGGEGCSRGLPGQSLRAGRNRARAVRGGGPTLRSLKGPAICAVDRRRSCCSQSWNRASHRIGCSARIPSRYRTGNF